MKTCYGPPASPFVSIDSLTGAARQSPTSICAFGQRRSGGILRRSVFLPVYNLKSTHRRSRFSFPNARLGVAPRRFAVTDQTVMAPPPEREWRARSPGGAACGRLSFNNCRNVMVRERRDVPGDALRISSAEPLKSSHNRHCFASNLRTIEVLDRDALSALSCSRHARSVGCPTQTSFRLSISALTWPAPLARSTAPLRNFGLR